MTDYTKLDKDALLLAVENLYTVAKPHQDALADGAIEILRASAEVYRRIIAKHAPGAQFTRTRVLTRINCSLNCMGNPAMELARRLNKFAEEGIQIVRVEFDENLHEYTLHAEALGETPSTPHTV